jgi:hypothetical protein
MKYEGDIPLLPGERYEEDDVPLSLEGLDEERLRLKLRPVRSLPVRWPLAYVEFLQSILVSVQLPLPVIWERELKEEREYVWALTKNPVTSTGNPSSVLTHILFSAPEPVMDEFLTWVCSHTFVDYSRGDFVEPVVYQHTFVDGPGFLPREGHVVSANTAKGCCVVRSVVHPIQAVWLNPPVELLNRSEVALHTGGL